MMDNTQQQQNLDADGNFKAVASASGSVSSVPLVLYNVLWIMGLLLGFPLLLIYAAVSPKLRHSFWQKAGFFDAGLMEQFHVLQSLPHGTVSATTDKVVWIHAVSVGEFNAVKPLIQDLEGACRVIVTTATRTGQDLAKKTFPEHLVFYFPFDFPLVIRRFFQLIKPDAVVLTETELWPNFIHTVTRQHIPLLLINGRISPGSFQGYQKIKPLAASMLKGFTHLYMQSEADRDRVVALGAPGSSVTVAGNIKFDIHPVVDPAQKAMLQRLLNFSAKDTVMTFASTHSGEDQPLVTQYLKLKKDFPELKLILAPRHPERLNEIRSILTAQSVQYSVRSQLTEEEINKEPVVVLDTIGELMAAYSLSHVAVMGGSFIEHGGQNPLEPIAMNVPVIFGPHMFNFPAISKLISDNHAGYQVENVTEICAKVTELLTQPEICSNMADNGQRLLEVNRGTKQVLCQAIHQVIQQQMDEPHAKDQVLQLN
ncbi:MAG: 3-deoxy-D-manno-octulosonic acid transferase [Vampirovibrio sp.]|nr:3-deoxy-D-manno-octulosonic acid transferase [Vampirovibrio sp.]